MGRGVLCVGVPLGVEGGAIPDAELAIVDPAGPTAEAGILFIFAFSYASQIGCTGVCSAGDAIGNPSPCPASAGDVICVVPTNPVTAPSSVTKCGMPAEVRFSLDDGAFH